MSAALTFVGVTGTGEGDFTNGQIICDFTIALTANYGGAATHGDTLNFANQAVFSNQVPTQVLVFEAPAAGTAPTGYFYTFCPGTTIANGVLSIFQCAGSAAPAVELTQGAAYPAALTAMTWLKCRAYFAKNI
jgi:hypothetical protein